MSDAEIQTIEKQIYELNMKLLDLRKSNALNDSIPNYEFQTHNGTRTLLELFADKSTLLLIHNMGQACRYCTLWADGFNGFLPHLESVMSVVLVSKDHPDIMRQFANARGWRFHLASHGGGDYIKDQNVQAGQNNTPGAVVYERKGDKIFRKNVCTFGPGDLYCSMWSLLGLAGLDASSWTPQYSYWQRPKKMDDGGENVIE